MSRRVTAIEHALAVGYGVGLNKRDERAYIRECKDKLIRWICIRRQGRQGLWQISSDWTCWEKLSDGDIAWVNLLNEQIIRRKDRKWRNKKHAVWGGDFFPNCFFCLWGVEFEEAIAMAARIATACSRGQHFKTMMEAQRVALKLP